MKFNINHLKNKVLTAITMQANETQGLSRSPFLKKYQQQRPFSNFPKTLICKSQLNLFKTV